MIQAEPYAQHMFDDNPSLILLEVGATDWFARRSIRVKSKSNLVYSFPANHSAAPLGF